MWKELHYFDGFRWSEHRDVSGYEGYFPRPEGKIAGEWTPGYMVDHWIPSLLAAAAPQTRLLVSLRDPVERYLSGLKRMLLNPRWRNARHPTEVLRTAYDAVLRSLYGPQLQHLRRHFPRSQILILQFERCVVAPDRELRRTFEFLGIDSDWSPNDGPSKGSGPAGGRRQEGLSAQVNAADISVELPETERRALVDFLEDDVRRVAAEYPEIDLALWPNFAHLAN
jgi:Sulfotransferase family